MQSQRNANEKNWGEKRGKDAFMFWNVRCNFVWLHEGTIYTFEAVKQML